MLTFGERAMAKTIRILLAVTCIALASCGGAVLTSGLTSTHAIAGVGDR
jgi:hypothetical protein